MTCCMTLPAMQAQLPAATMPGLCSTNRKLGRVGAGGGGGCGRVEESTYCFAWHGPTLAVVEQNRVVQGTALLPQAPGGG